jgi:hypothetical protein
VFYINHGVVSETDIQRVFIVFVTGTLTPVLIGVLPILWLITRLRAAS